MKQIAWFIQRHTQRITTATLMGLLIIACTDHTPPTDPQPPVVTCQLANGTIRPYPCEFSIEKLIFLGNDGSTLGEVTPAMANITLSIAKAKTNVLSGSVGSVTYAVKAVVRRQNAPSFSVNTGYILSYAFVNKALQSDPRPIITATQQFPIAIGEQQEALFDLRFNYSKSGSLVTFENGPLSFFIENDVTTTKFAVVSSVPVSDKAEATISLQASIIN
ncbi:hypothetical protein [Spirosoma koreense]